MKYKVGDRVIIRGDLKSGQNYGACAFVNAMEKLKGKISTIIEVCDNHYKLKEDEVNYYWTDEMIADKVVEVTCKAEDYDFSDCTIYGTDLLKPYTAEVNNTYEPSLDLNKVWNDLVKSYEEKNMNLDITNINIIVPNKVVEVFFSDGLKEKMVCHEEDTFDLRNCLFIAIAKHLYKSEYTLEGIEYKSNELKLMKKYVKIVDTALKNYKNTEAAIKKAKKEEAAAQATAERKKAKLAKYKAKRKEKYRKERIEEMIEAYVNAMMIYDDICTGDPCETCECDSRYECPDCECRENFETE